MSRRPGIVLLILLLLTIALCRGRAAFPPEGPPAVFFEKRSGILVGLGAGFPSIGIHQFSDGTLLEAVIKMTDLDPSTLVLSAAQAESPLQDGEYLEIESVEGEVVVLTRNWLSAGQRVALSIPLHPDRMTIADWEFLPGIGPRLAETIEADRQLNGDFGSLEGLIRVRGIGPGRIKAFEPYFLHL